MKTTLIFVFTLVSTLAIAQQKVSVNRQINDDGKTLSIRIDGSVNGRSINYDRRFDVASLSKTERESLRNHILDSLSIATSVPIPPATLFAPKPPRAFRPDQGVRQAESITKADRSMGSVSTENGRTVAVSGEQPFIKVVSYNAETGQLLLRYRYIKNGEDVDYERTINARGKSEQERHRIVERVEKELGLPVNSR